MNINKTMNRLTGDDSYDKLISMINHIWEEFGEHLTLVIDNQEVQKGELVRCIVNTVALQKLLIARNIITAEDLDPYIEQTFAEMTLPAGSSSDTQSTVEDIEV